MEFLSRWLELGRHRGRGHGAPPERQSATKEPKIAELGACLLPPAAGWVGGCVGQACRVQPFAAVFIFLARPVRRIFGAIPPLDGEIWSRWNLGTNLSGRPNTRFLHLPLFSASLQPSACFSVFLLFPRQLTSSALLRKVHPRSTAATCRNAGRAARRGSWRPSP